MYHKYFLKGKCISHGKFIASSLASVFGAGMFGSYAGAMENVKRPNPSTEKLKKEFLSKKAERLNNIFDNGNPVKENTKDAKEAIKCCYSLDNGLRKQIFAQCEDVDELGKFVENKSNAVRFCAYLIVLNAKADDKKVADLKLNLVSGICSNTLSVLKSENKKKLIVKIANGWGKKLYEEVENNKKDKKIISNTGQFCKADLCKAITITVFVIAAIIAIIAFVVTATAAKGKFNMGDNEDDEKVNPSIDPENPLTDPESDEQNPEQKKQEQESSVGSVETANLKAVGASVFLGGGLAGYGTYLVNEVLLKHGKSSEVKNPKNVNGKHMSLDSAGNKVTKTEEGKEIHNSDGTKNKGIGDSDAKQYLEDKDVEKTEEEQEEILESSALSDDTEATGD